VEGYENRVYIPDEVALEVRLPTAHTEAPQEPTLMDEFTWSSPSAVLCLLQPIYPALGSSLFKPKVSGLVDVITVHFLLLIRQATNSLISYKEKLIW